MPMNSSVFKSYDIRGVVPEEINEQFAYALGPAFVSYLSAHGAAEPLTVVVGRDNRLSSDALADSLVAGLMVRGATVVDIGLASTPLFDWVVLSQKALGGIMVTASHNPPQFNGFKMMGPGITPIGGDTGMTKIRKLMEMGSATISKAERNIGNIAKVADTISQYIDACFALVPPSPDIVKLKVVVDAGNGVSALMAQAQFDRLPCAMTPLFFELDGTFPNHEPNPLVEENLRFLKAEIEKQRADIGIALDTDGDRIILLDEKGRMANDVTIALLAKEFLKKRPGAKILYDIRSSHAVPETIAACGGIPIITPVGHTLIKAAMRKEGGLFAGELSGHYYFSDVGNFEAPPLVINAILNLLSGSGKKLSQLTDELRAYFPTGEINFRVEDKAHVLQNIEKRYTDVKLSRLDGITIEYPDWWANIRPSNTENVLRLNLEATTEKLRDEKRGELEALITEPA